MKNKSVIDKYELLFENLMLHMRLNKIKKQDLSELSKINYSQLSRYLNQHNEIPLKVFLELCEATNITLAELENYQDDAPPPTTVKKELLELKKMIKSMSQTQSEIIKKSKI